MAIQQNMNVICLFQGRYSAHNKLFYSQDSGRGFVYIQTLSKRKHYLLNQNEMCKTQMLSWKGKKSLKQKFHKHTTDIRKKEFKTKALQTYNRYKKKCYKP